MVRRAGALIRAGMGTLSFILDHPLNRRRRSQALRDYVAWQIGSRLVSGPVAVPFVGDSRLLVRPGMRGATGNVYTGLHEAEAMGFLLHALRPDDEFVDIGANVGAFTVLASAGVGCSTVAIEPDERALIALGDNLRLNGIEPRVRTLRAVLGREVGEAYVTSVFDTVNHVVDRPTGSCVKTPMRTLDTIDLRDARRAIKIDVEGYETDVLAGGLSTIADPATFAIVIELNGSGSRYGYDEGEIRTLLQGLGFKPVSYDVRRRELRVGGEALGDSVVFVRDVAEASDLVRTAPRYRVGSSVL